jgi:hypothetical protein
VPIEPRCVRLPRRSRCTIRCAGARHQRRRCSLARSRTAWSSSRASAR